MEDGLIDAEAYIAAVDLAIRLTVIREGLLKPLQDGLLIVYATNSPEAFEQHEEMIRTALDRVIQSYD